MEIPNKYRHLMLEAIEALDRSQARIAELESGGREPIAIVGLGCRFPGNVDGPEAYWRLLDGGIDAISEIPADRWDVDAFYNPDPDSPGTMVTRHGGFVEALDKFEPKFFGISPREAGSMDPQQRLLLEVAWEAMEDAGMASADRASLAAGVFVGITSFDYAARLLHRTDADRIDAYFSSGNLHNAAAGRLSYVLGLQGPSLAIDTACSSSLVSVHIACQSLRARECSVALAGGVNAILNPEGMIATSRAHMLSPDGRCKTFDAAADGYVRGEGCGIVVLKRLRDAVDDRDRVLAVIRGSAVNQNGAGSGLTVPSGPAQERLISRALEQAGLHPRAIDYIEAHGTGTALGDPIEINALTNVFGRDRERSAALLVGSVKTNIGHLESAAGIAGLIKVVLALQRERMPGQLNVSKPHPLIPWGAIPVEILRESRPWPRTDRLRAGGVSSFGFSGTNAHVVVGEAPFSAEKEKGWTASHHLLVLSAPSFERLSELAVAYEARLRAAPETRPEDVCYTAATGRAHFHCRAAVVGGNLGEIASGLQRIAREQPPGGVSRSRPPRVAFLFTGQASQYPGMGRALYETMPVFRAAMDECNEALHGHLAIGLVEVLYGAPEHAPLIHQTEYAQPALFALGYALTQVWIEWGIRPDVVLGHSLGELVAACAAGVIDMEPAIRLIALRGRLMQSVERNGSMVAIRGSLRRIREALEPYGDTISVAAINGPDNVVISGLAEHVEAVVAMLGQEGIRGQALEASHAFHSPLMRPVLAPFEAALREVELRPPSSRIVSALTGDLIEEEIARPEHWSTHVTAPVDFEAALRRAATLGCDAYVEIGPAPVLLSLGRAVIKDAETKWLPSLRPARADSLQMLDSLGKLYVLGARVDGDALYRGAACRRVSLPRTPFRRDRYWVEISPARAPPAGANLDPQSAGPPHLGRRLSLPGGRDTRFQAHYRTSSPAYVTDHRLDEIMVVPAASHIVAALSAARQDFDDGRCYLRELLFPAVMLLGESDSVSVQTVVHRGDPATFEIFGAGSLEGQDEWLLHAQGELGRPIPAVPKTDFPVEPGVPTRPPDVEGADFYQRFRAVGYTLGPAFQWIEAIWLRGDEALCRLREPLLSEDPSTYPIHPGLLDSCFQVLAGWPQTAASEITAEARMYVPFRIDRFTFHRPPADKVIWCKVRRAPVDDASRTLRADIELFDAAGGKLVEIEGFEARQMRRSVLLGQRQTQLPTLLYEMAWRPHPRQDGNVHDRPAWLILADEGGLGERVAAELTRRGAVCAVLHAGVGFRHPSPDRFVVDPENSVDMAQALRTWIEHSKAQDRGVLHLWGLDPGTGGQRSLQDLQTVVRRACASLLNVVRSLAEAGGATRLALVSRGTQAAEPASPTRHPEQAPSWGFLRVAARELPELRCTCIDLDPTPDDAEAILLADELVGADREEQVAFRGRSRLVGRLVARRSRAMSDAFGKPALPIRADASYLVAGGTGALGLRVARWLVEEADARHVVLVGRHASMSPQIRAVLDRFSGSGAEIRIEAADISDRAAVDDLLRRMAETLPPLRGVIHAAGVLDDGLLSDQNWSRISSVLAPKLAGGWNLHEATKDLDFFVTFSSAAVWLGPPGQASYAAANAFLDALAHHRRSLGLSATSINWGPWAGSGMVSRLTDRDRLRLTGLGMELLSDDQALGALSEALAEDLTQVGVMAVRWPRFFMQGAANPASSLLSELRPIDMTARASSRGALRLALEAADPAVRRGVLETRIVELVAKVLGFASGDTRAIEVDAGLFDIGMDSLSALELRNDLQDELDCELGATLAFKFPTVTSMADGVLALVELAPAPTSRSDSDGADESGPGVSDLSEAELESMINRELQRLSILEQ